MKRLLVPAVLGTFLLIYIGSYLAIRRSVLEDQPWAPPPGAPATPAPPPVLEVHLLYYRLAPSPGLGRVLAGLHAPLIYLDERSSGRGFAYGFEEGVLDY